MLTQQDLDAIRRIVREEIEHERIRQADREARMALAIIPPY